jgi:hypothetical protein
LPVRTCRLLSVALSAFILSVCGGGDSGTGVGPSIPIVPTPEPTPTPVPTPPPLSASCAKLPLGNPAAKCDTQKPDFQDDVKDAIETLRGERPDVVSGNQVLNVGAYFVGIIQILDRQGICAMTENGEELGVKRNNDYSEQYDILTAKDTVRNYYAGTCTPAVFPGPERAPYPQPAGCTLPPSHYIACGRPGDGEYYADVTAAVEQVMRERPELFDYSDTVRGTGWPAVRDPTAYQNGVVSILVGKGYCAIFDGEEITAKRTNEFTEHYDINYSDRYVRLGSGIYRGACYPAAF